MPEFANVALFQYLLNFTFQHIKSSNWHHRPVTMSRYCRNHKKVQTWFHSDMWGQVELSCMILGPVA